MSDSPLMLLAHGLTGSSWPLVITYAIVVTQLTIFSVTIYLHRCATHRGVDLHPVVSHFFRFWTWLTTAMVTKEWVAIHRKHHARCETEEDPHSPKVHGIGRVFFHGVVLYQHACKDREMIEQYGRGTPEDWIERKVYTPWSAAGPTLMLFINLALFGAVGLVIWAIQMLWIPIMAAGVVNGLGHWWGYRNFETSDMATNLVPWGLVIGGEELHNNHHAFPSSAKFSLRPFEFDIGWAVIRGFELLGLAKVLRVAPMLAQREGVEAADDETLKALMAHRFSVMKAYWRSVIVPVLQHEAQAASASIAGRLKRALANDGRWLDEPTRAKLAAIVAQRPSLATVVEHRQRLTALLDRAGRGSSEVIEALQQWCRDAEASGIQSLADYARRLRGYSLRAVPASA